MKKTGFIILIFSGFFLNLLCLGLAFAQVSAPISNQDRASVETLRLIEPVPYPISDQKDFALWYNKTKTGLGLWLISAQFSAEDLSQLANDALNDKKSDLKETVDKYFPNKKEQSQLIDEASRKLADGMGIFASREKNLGQIRKVIKEYSNIILERVLAVEGLEDSLLRNMWVSKITAPFFQCVDQAPHKEHLEACFSAFQASVVPNVGMAVVDYNILTKLRGLNETQAQERRGASRSKIDSCLRDSQKQLSNASKMCVLEGRDRAIVSLAHETVKNKLMGEVKLSSGSTEKVWNSVSGPLQICLKRAKTTPEVFPCLDDLTVNTAEIAARERILGHPAVQETYLDDASRRKMAEPIVDAFRKCVRRREKKISGWMD